MNISLRTVKDATQHWVSTFNSVSYHMFERAYAQHGLEGAEVIAAPYRECAHCDAKVELERKSCEHCDGEELYWPNTLPMWGTLFSFGEYIDECWCEENPELVAACGFLVYKTDDDEIFLGINGAGYDFYEAHWIPLYKARGLQWHEREEEKYASV